MQTAAARQVSGVAPPASAVAGGTSSPVVTAATPPAMGAGAAHATARCFPCQRFFTCGAQHPPGGSHRTSSQTGGDSSCCGGGGRVVSHLVFAPAHPPSDVRPLVPELFVQLLQTPVGRRRRDSQPARQRVGVRPGARRQPPGHSLSTGRGPAAAIRTFSTSSSSGVQGFR